MQKTVVCLLRVYIFLVVLGSIGMMRKPKTDYARMVRDGETLYEFDLQKENRYAKAEEPHIIS